MAGESPLPRNSWKFTSLTSLFLKEFTGILAIYFIHFSPALKSHLRTERTKTTSYLKDTKFVLPTSTLCLCFVLWEKTQLTHYQTFPGLLLASKWLFKQSFSSNGYFIWILVTLETSLHLFFQHTSSMLCTVRYQLFFQFWNSLF